MKPAGPTGWINPRLIRDHLKDAHKQDLASLLDAELEKSGLFICRECEDQLFVSLSDLNKHIRTQHIEYRLLNNLQLVETTIFESLRGNYQSEWKDGLRFLHQLKLDPPNFRQPLTAKIRFRLEASVCETFASVIEACNEALKPPSNPKFKRKDDYDPWQVLQLANLSFSFPFQANQIKTIYLCAAGFGP